MHHSLVECFTFFIFFWQNELPNILWWLFVTCSIITWPSVKKWSCTGSTGGGRGGGDCRARQQSLLVCSLSWKTKLASRWMVDICQGGYFRLAGTGRHFGGAILRDRVYELTIEAGAVWADWFLVPSLSKIAAFFVVRRMHIRSICQNAVNREDNELSRRKLLMCVHEVSSCLEFTYFTWLDGLSPLSFWDSRIVSSTKATV